MEIFEREVGLTTVLELSGDLRGALDSFTPCSPVGDEEKEHDMRSPDSVRPQDTRNGAPSPDFDLGCRLKALKGIAERYPRRSAEDRIVVEAAEALLAPAHSTLLREFRDALETRGTTNSLPQIFRKMGLPE